MSTVSLGDWFCSMHSRCIRRIVVFGGLVRAHCFRLPSCEPWQVGVRSPPEIAVSKDGRSWPFVYVCMVDIFFLVRAGVHSPPPPFSWPAWVQVTHSPLGKVILEAFVVDICQAPTDWNMADIAEEFIREVSCRSRW